MKTFPRYMYLDGFGKFFGDFNPKFFFTLIKIKEEKMG